MKCHYEVLEVPKDANADDIKKAYRRLAIKWHPDKNLENTESATEQFKLIQQAFEVLSDPHERAWYDDHREAILKGKVGAECDDESLDVYQYFTASSYQGFGDDEKGFYSVYREVFNQIVAEDSEYRTEDDSDFEIPSFGKSNSSYEEVNSFYNYWQSYCTKKSYSWLDPFDTREAPNRRVSRAMEKENKKVRDKARKARNEEVRELVKFVRKRDKRVIAHAQYLQELSAEKAKKLEEKRLETIRARKSELANHKESEWAKFSNLENELKDIEANLVSEFGDSISPENSDEEEMMNHGLYCIACNKLFKTPKAFENHESSKKHRDNVLALKEQMKDSDDDLGLDIDVSDEDIEDYDSKDDSNVDSSSSDTPDEIIEKDVEEVSGNNDNVRDPTFIFDQTENNSDESSLFCKSCGRWFKTKKAIKNHRSSQDHIKNSKLYNEILKNLGSDTEVDDDSQKSFGTDSEKDILEDLTDCEGDFREDLARVESKFNDVSKATMISLSETEEIDRICEELDVIIKKNEKLDLEEAKLSKSSKKKKSKTKTSQLLSDSDEDLDFSMGLSKKQKRKQQSRQQLLSKNKEKADTNLTKEPVITDIQSSNDQEEESLKISSVPQNNVALDDCEPSIKSESDTDHQETTSKPSTASNKNRKKKEKNNNTNKVDDLNTSCAVCKANFPSKNKLFQHLNKTGHSVYLSEKSSKIEDVDKDSFKKGKNKKNKK